MVEVNPAPSGGGKIRLYIMLPNSPLETLSREKRKEATDIVHRGEGGSIHSFLGVFSIPLELFLDEVTFQPQRVITHPKIDQSGDIPPNRIICVLFANCRESQVRTFESQVRTMSVTF